MTNHLHNLDVYEDGWTKTAYCKICSAEGIKLYEPCVGMPFHEMTKEEFDIKFGKPIDQMKPKR